MTRVGQHPTGRAKRPAAGQIGARASVWNRRAGTPRIPPGWLRAKRPALPARGPARASASAAHARPAAATAAARPLRVGKLNLDRATVESLAVEHADGLLGFLVGRHLDETEP